MRCPICCPKSTRTGCRLKLFLLRQSCRRRSIQPTNRRSVEHDGTLRAGVTSSELVPRERPRPGAGSNHAKTATLACRRGCVATRDRGGKKKARQPWGIAAGESWRSPWMQLECSASVSHHKKRPQCTGGRRRCGQSFAACSTWEKTVELAVGSI